MTTSKQLTDFTWPLWRQKVTMLYHHISTWSYNNVLNLTTMSPTGWPLWRTTYLCTTSPLRMLSKWPWISHCGDYWQPAELRTDGACRIMMMMMMMSRHSTRRCNIHSRHGSMLNVVVIS